jgi:hypothetical protein
MKCCRHLKTISRSVFGASEQPVAPVSLGRALEMLCRIAVFLPVRDLNPLIGHQLAGL